MNRTGLTNDMPRASTGQSDMPRLRILLVNEYQDVVGSLVIYSNMCVLLKKVHSCMSRIEFANVNAMLIDKVCTSRAK